MTALEQLQALPIWQGTVRATPLGGGITNVNFVAEDDNKRVVVRVGDDIAVHQIMRFNELSASQAAYAAGVSPRTRATSTPTSVLPCGTERTAYHRRVRRRQSE